MEMTLWSAPRHWIQNTDVLVLYFNPFALKTPVDVFVPNLAQLFGVANVITYDSFLSIGSGVSIL